MRHLVKVMKALSDETRLRILNLLMERECCVCEVWQALDISETRASRNLNALLDAGFLLVRREGTWASYSIMEGVAKYYSELLQSLTEALEGNELVEKDRERLKKVQRIGPRQTAMSRIGSLTGPIKL